MSTETKQVRRANQIALFYGSQPGTNQVDQLAAHLKAYWEPRVLGQLFDAVDKGLGEPNPLVVKAAAMLRTPA